MTPRLRLVPIVEGHGEYQAVRTLVERIGRELLAGGHIEVLRPIRQPRSRLVQEENLQRAVKLAATKLKASSSPETPDMVLILLDADEDPACMLGLKLLAWAKKARPDIDIACVLAVNEYETWFVAAAESLRAYLTFEQNEAPEEPEAARCGKAWIRRHRIGPAKYSETVDQPAMTARMDITLCRKRSPSFDKLCREFEKRRT